MKKAVERIVTQLLEREEPDPEDINFPDGTGAGFFSEGSYALVTLPKNVLDIHVFTAYEFQSAGLALANPNPAWKSIENVERLLRDWEKLKFAARKYREGNRKDGDWVWWAGDVLQSHPEYRKLLKQRY